MPSGPATLLKLHRRPTDYLCQGFNLFFNGRRDGQVVDDGFAGLYSAHQFRKTRVIYFQAVTDNGPRFRIDGLVVYDILRASFEGVADVLVVG